MSKVIEEGNNNAKNRFPAAHSRTQSMAGVNHSISHNASHQQSIQQHNQNKSYYSHTPVLVNQSGGEQSGFLEMGALWGQSASSWRNSSYSYSFPKGNRFEFKSNINRRRTTVRKSDMKPQEDEVADNDQADTNINNSEQTLNLPSTRSSRFTTLGHGKKQYLSIEDIRKARNNPPPGHTQQIFHKLSIPSVALGSAERFMQISGTQTPVNAAVGSYDIAQKLGSGRIYATLKGRSKNSIDLQSEVPSANYYSPKSTITTPNKFSRITFGKGWKTDFSKCDPNIPGPGQYRAPSQFDRFKKALANWQSPVERRRGTDSQLQSQGNSFRQKANQSNQFSMQI